MSYIVVQKVKGRSGLDCEVGGLSDLHTTLEVKGPSWTSIMIKSCLPAFCQESAGDRVCLRQRQSMGVKGGLAGWP